MTTASGQSLQECITCLFYNHNLGPYKMLFLTRTSLRRVSSAFRRHPNFLGKLNKTGRVNYIRQTFVHKHDYLFRLPGNTLQICMSQTFWTAVRFDIRADISPKYTYIYFSHCYTTMMWHVSCCTHMCVLRFLGSATGIPHSVNLLWYCVPALPAKAYCFYIPKKISPGVLCKPYQELDNLCHRLPTPRHMSQLL